MRISNQITAVLVIFLVVVAKLIFSHQLVINEDELSYLRYSSNLLQGYIPFTHFFDIFSPFFQFLLTPLVSIFKGDPLSIFNIRLILQIYFIIGHIFFYLLVKKYLKRTNALLCLLLTILNSTYISDSIEIRALMISLPSFYIGTYFFLASRLNSNLKVFIYALFITLITIIDHRFIVILPFIIYVLYMIERKNLIVALTAISLFFPFCFILFNLTLSNTFLTVAFKMISILPNSIQNKDPHSILKLLNKDFFIILLALFSFWKLLKHSNKDSNLHMITVFSLIGFTALSFISHSFYRFFIYFMPLFSITIATYFFKLTRYRYFFLSCVSGQSILLILNLNYILNFYPFISTHEQKKHLEFINQKIIEENKTVLNLSRFQFDTYGPLMNAYPSMIEEDISTGFSRLNYYSLFLQRIHGIIKDLEPDLIIFNIEDNYLDEKLTKLITSSYHNVENLDYIYSRIKTSPKKRESNSNFLLKKQCKELINVIINFSHEDKEEIKKEAFFE